MPHPLIDAALWLKILKTGCLEESGARGEAILRPLEDVWIVPCRGQGWGGERTRGERGMGFSELLDSMGPLAVVRQIRKGDLMVLGETARSARREEFRPRVQGAVGTVLSGWRPQG
jgi:hypothetical protein